MSDEVTQHVFTADSGLSRGGGRLPADGAGRLEAIAATLGVAADDPFAAAVAGHLRRGYEVDTFTPDGDRCVFLPAAPVGDVRMARPCPRY